MTDNIEQEGAEAPAVDEELANIPLEGHTEQETKTEPVELPAPAPAGNVDVEAAAIVASNENLVSQMQELIPPQDEEPTQAPSDDSEAQDAGPSSAQFEFDEGIVNNFLDDPQATFQHVAQTIHAQAVQDAFDMVSNAYNEMMQAQQQEVTQQQDVAQAAQTFYSDNADLEGHKETVSAVAAQLAQKYPFWTQEQLLGTTAQMVRSHLGTTKTQDLGSQQVSNLNPVAEGQSFEQPVLSDDQLELASTLKHAAGRTIF